LIFKYGDVGVKRCRDEDWEKIFKQGDIATSSAAKVGLDLRAVLESDKLIRECRNVEIGRERKECIIEWSVVDLGVGIVENVMQEGIVDVVIVRILAK
jgi:hypothetical protein